MNANKAQRAYDACIDAGIPVGVNFFSLNSRQTEALHALAREFGYRKPRDANGSTARYFYAYAQRGRVSP